MSIPPGTDLSRVQGLRPPPGVLSNFVNPESRAHATIVGNGVATGIMMVFVITRMYTKLFISKVFGWEDYCCVIAATMALSYMGMIAYVFNTGLGAHQWDIPVTVLLNETTIKYLRALNYLYGPAMVFAKLSILLLYFQLFNVNRITRIFIYFMITLTVLLHLIGTFVGIGLCPSSDPIPYSECSSRLNPEDITISSINIFSDFYILAIPMIVVSKLQLARNKRIGLIAIFLTGFLACISSILGLVYRISLLNTKDSSWYLSPLLTFTFLELNVGIIVGCLPILPALLRKMNLTSLHASFLRSVRSKGSKSSGARLVQGDSWDNNYHNSHESGSRPFYSQKLPSTAKASKVENDDAQLSELRKPDTLV